MTDRLMRALESPSIRVMGHPTGRMLLNRDPFPFDFERVAADAARRNVYLEINGSPERLDLSQLHGSNGEGFGREVHHFDRFAPDQASPPKHALRRHHSATRLAGGR